ncbi:MAG: di-heme oxidoredictase family protein [Planctomycetota bacterium]
MLHRFVVLFALLITSTSAWAQSGAPSYSGEVCFTGSTATIAVTANPTATAILIYPNPPGGGYFMTNDGAGNYSATFSGLPAGAQFSFHLVIQVPQQYEFPTHSFTVAEGCTAFGTGNDNDGGDNGGDNGGGDNGGGIDPGDFGQGGLPHSRAFRHDVTETNGDWSVLLETGQPASPLPGVTGVELRYRIADGPMQTEPMADLGGFIWGRTIPDVFPGDEISYTFVKTVGIEPVDTAWFTRTIGDAAPTLPADPIETIVGLRFRDRHENEWRFDHYPAGYDVGRTFDLRITDRGDRLDIELTTAPEVPVNAVDIKWYNQAGDVGFCDRNISAISTRMAGGGGSFTSTIDNLVHGQRVDIEFTLLAAQTYYSEFIYYYVGDGRLQRESQHPLAYAAGDASIPVVTIKQFAFNQHALNLAPTQLGEFMEGKVAFETRWDDGLLFNPPTAFDCNGGPVGFNMGPSPVFEPGLLGPLYTNNSCIECHMLDGRGSAPTSVTDSLEDYVVRLSIPGQPGAAPQPHPFYGVQLDTRAVPGATPEGKASIEWEFIAGTFDDGTPYELRRPRVEFTELLYGDIGTNVPGTSAATTVGGPYNGEAEVSVRVAPMLVGLGLLEAVDESEILAWADENDTNGDGISGRANYVDDVVTGQLVLGRFGWKAGQPDLKQQAASAFAHDMGMSSSLFGDGPEEVDASELDEMVAYLRGLAVPPRENYLNPIAQQGKMLFEGAGCMSCHRPAMRTATNAAFAPYRDQVIQPFTDLLLHDMGPGLADNRPEFGANGYEWRTPPLWGIGYVGHVLGTPTDPFNPNGTPAEPNYLHDGRARTLMEAILWHGGEGEASKNAVLAMNATERDALIEYVKFPFVDPTTALAEPSCTGDLTSTGGTLAGQPGFGVPDGAADLDDLGYYLGFFLATDASVADLTTSGATLQGQPGFGISDGAVDLDDLGYFLNAWLQGCP